MSFYLDDPEVLRRAVHIAPTLEGIEETEVDGQGPSWAFGRICLAKGYPGYELHDCLHEILPDEVFRKVRFEIPEENLRGILVVLPYTREGDKVYESIVGQVPLDLEGQLDEWLDFLNGQIRLAHAAIAARRRGST